MRQVNGEMWRQATTLFGRRTQVTSTTTDPFGTVIRGAKYVQVKVKF